MNNVLQMPDPRAVSVKKAIDAWKQSESWSREKLIALAIELKLARDSHGSDAAFGHWLAENDCDILNHQDRSALINMAKHIDVTREVLEETKRRSPQLIWKEDVKPRITSASKPQTDENSGGFSGRPVKLKDGVTLSDMGREVVKLLQSGVAGDKAAKQLAISLQTLNCLRDITMLSERSDLGDADSRTVTQAIILMNERQQVREAMAMVQPIADRMWGPKGQRLKADKSRLSKFIDAIRVVQSVCENAVSIDIPYINADQAKSFHQSLVEAKEAIDKLDQRIKEGAR